MTVATPKPRVRVTSDGKIVPIAGRGGAPVKSYYEGGSMSPRIRGRGSISVGPNVSIAGNLSVLQARSYNLLRNNGYAAGAQESYVSNMIGSGIRPKWGVPEIQTLWDRWVQVADADGLGSFYALQALAASAQFSAGEVFGRFRYRRLADGLPVPLQLQVLESAHLDHSHSRFWNNTLIKMGIEFNGIGQRTAYHFWRYHPHEKLTAQFNSRVAVPASEVVHMFRRTRPGQLRGVPELTSVIVRLYEIDAMQDAMLARQKFAQLFGAFIYRDGSGEEDPVFGTQVQDAFEEEPLSEFVPGAIHYLDSGEKVEFSDPPDIGSSYANWLSTELRAVAQGAGLTYEQLTGDLTGVNYSSIRTGLLEFRRRMEALQAHMIVAQFCRPIAAKWLDLAVAMGMISLPDYDARRDEYLAIDWVAPRWQWVDPLKEITADILEVRAGFTPRSEKAAERQWALADLDRAIKESNDSADEHEFVLDSDPRRTTRAGLAPARDVLAEEEEAANNSAEE
jgi:lambda family phage portal protein